MSSHLKAKSTLTNSIETFAVLEVCITHNMSSATHVVPPEWLETIKNFLLVVPKAELLLLKLIQIFARAVLVMKKLEIEETKTTLYSTFKTDK